MQRSSEVRCTFAEILVIDFIEIQRDVSIRKIHRPSRRLFIKNLVSVVGAALLPRFLKANPGIYNFSGTITDILDNPVDGATVKFII